jgi:uncharacterized protein
MVISSDDYQTKIAEELAISRKQVQKTLSLLEDGNTIPFIARYRKDTTDGLDEVLIRKIKNRIHYHQKLLRRKEEVISYLKSESLLSEKLANEIKRLTNLEILENIFKSYYQEQPSKGTIAIEKGLEPLANYIINGTIMEGEINDIVSGYIDEEKGITSIAEALDGAIFIIAEQIANNPFVQKILLKACRQRATLKIQGLQENDPKGIFEEYYHYQDRIDDLPPHRVLAINRGRKKGALLLKIILPEEEIIDWLGRKFATNEKSIFTDYLKKSLKVSFDEYLVSNLKEQIWKKALDLAEEHALRIFATNLRKILLSPPCPETTILGIDPGFRSGCKIAIIDKTGKILRTAIIYPHSPQNQRDEAQALLEELITKYYVQVVAIGNGTASKETVEIVSNVLNRIARDDLGYLIVDESGASIHSVSNKAREEFPNLDPTLRSAVHIARRVLDPLAELVKVPPKSIGIGLYQHDIEIKKLIEIVKIVTESCVNHVGVNINTASKELLQYVSGLTPKTVEAIVAYREQKGMFRTREELLNVPGISAVIYKQAAGFLKVLYGKNPLDATFIHPESYDKVQKLLEKMNSYPNDPQLSKKAKKVRAEINLHSDFLSKITTELDLGEFTLRDILINLEKPFLDPRSVIIPKKLLKKKLSLEDLKPGMIVEGVVRNVVDFGAFVDIGLKTDGLIHISELSTEFVKSPFNIVSVGDIVRVNIMEVDLQRERIALSMRDVEQN